MIDLIIFDCDGVVVDSELLANTLAANLKTKMGYPISPKEHIEKFVGLSNSSPEYLEVFKKLPANYSEIASTKREEVFRKELKAIDGIEDTLNRLSIPFCLASSGTMEKMSLTLGITGLYSRFQDKIFSAEMVARGKPAPDVFLLAAKEMGILPKKCLVIEDSTPGVQAARAAGMKVIGFTGGSHMFDFMKERLQREQPDYVFSRMLDLPRLIDRYH